MAKGDVLEVAVGCSASRASARPAWAGRPTCGQVTPRRWLLLVDHIAASWRGLRAVQWLYERYTIPAEGEHFRRRPLTLLRDLGFEIEETERFKLGIVERVCARKPG